MTDNKKFSKVFANDNSMILFCPFSPLYFKPALVPSSGKTEITFFGNGFVNSGSQSVRFTLEGDQIETDLEYDEKTNTFFCRAPIFEKVSKKYSYPLSCKVEISLDKKKYFSYHRPLLIYCNHANLHSFEVADTEHRAKLRISPRWHCGQIVHAIASSSARIPRQYNCRLQKHQRGPAPVERGQDIKPLRLDLQRGPLQQ